MTTQKTTEKKKKHTTKKTDSKELESLKLELKETNDKLLRTIADFQNYQKRMQKELLSTEADTKKRYLSELLDLHELLKKAYDDSNPKEGLKLLLSNIENFFEKEKITPIECVGKKFDHNIHHALTAVEKNDCEDNEIIEEVKKGYLIKNNLLRPAQVIVAKNKKEE